MDTHFKTADFKKHAPVILALLSIWYNNFFGAESEALDSVYSIFAKISAILATRNYGK
jgi:glucose-6-phosphate isomerase